MCVGGEISEVRGLKSMGDDGINHCLLPHFLQRIPSFRQREIRLWNITV